MSEEIKDMLQAILEGQQKLSAELQGFRKETNERLDRMEGNIKDLKHEQKNQGKLMEKLAFRSLKMESEIDEIREQVGGEK